MSRRIERILRALARVVAPGVTFTGADEAPYANPPGFATSTSDARHGTWMQTFTGRKFWPLDPRPGEVAIEDVAHGLAMSCRYGGHASRYYSVAEHCVLVSHAIAPEYAREALLHDSAEAYIGDMIRPLKHQPEMAEFRRAEAVIERAVFAALGIVQTDASRTAVKEVDDRILVDEIHALMRSPGMYLLRDKKAPGANVGLEPLGVIIRGWTPAVAEEQFLQRFAVLFPEVSL